MKLLIKISNKKKTEIFHKKFLKSQSITDKVGLIIWLTLCLLVYGVFMKRALLKLNKVFLRIFTKISNKKLKFNLQSGHLFKTYKICQKIKLLDSVLRKPKIMGDKKEDFL